MATLSKFQKFEPKRIHRRDIKNAPYNPREIDSFAKKQLRDNLKKVGLLNALVWNAKTGNLVSGHQRLGLLDALEGSDDYLLDVNVVKLSVVQEKKQNLFFNNHEAQGRFDVEKLGVMFETPEFTIDDTGFTKLGLEVAFAGTEFASLFSDAKQPESVKKNIAELNEMADGALEAARARRKQLREEMRIKDADEDTEFQVVVVLESRAQTNLLMVALGAPAGDKFVDGRVLLDRLGIEHG